MRVTTATMTSSSAATSLVAGTTMGVRTITARNLTTTNAATMATAGFSRLVGDRGGSCYDPQARRRKIPALFAQEKSAHWQAPQPRHLSHQKGRAPARELDPIFQTALEAEIGRAHV